MENAWSRSSTRAIWVGKPFARRDDKLASRVEHLKPAVEAFFRWCEDTLADQALLPSNPLTKALSYALKRRSELSVFLTDPNVAIDTNHLERAIRPVALGRNYPQSSVMEGCPH